jgi:hypothetical protein
MKEKLPQDLKRKPTYREPDKETYFFLFGKRYHLTQRSDLRRNEEPEELNLEKLDWRYQRRRT